MKLHWMCIIFIQCGLTTCYYGFMSGYDSVLTPPSSARGGSVGGSIFGNDIEEVRNCYAPIESHHTKLCFMNLNDNMCSLYDNIHAILEAGKDQIPQGCHIDPEEHDIWDGGIKVVIIVFIFGLCQVVVSLISWFWKKR